MRTINGNGIVEFDAHVDRLGHSLAEIHPKRYTEVNIREKIEPLIKEGLDIYGKHNSESESKVSILITYKENMILAAHFSALGTNEKSAKVLVSHRSRTAPTVKDSSWVEERADLEREKPKDVNEVLLVDNGLIYEGMSSNFLAVKQVNGKPVLICAGLEHILLGTILKIIMRICRQEEIEILWDFPRLSEADQWEGCFITSTSRLVLPISTIYNETET